MAVAYEGGVVLGADSRTTMGSYIANRVTDKLTHISDRIYCCRSGSAADTQAIADVITYYLDMYAVEHDGPLPVATAAHLFSQLVYSNKDRLSAGIIVAGWDKKKGGTVYNVPLGGGVFQQPWAIGGKRSKPCPFEASRTELCDSSRNRAITDVTLLQPIHCCPVGSGSTYIYGYCDSTWRPGWGREETLRFVKNALSLAMSRDGSSGGTIRMVDITEKGVQRHFILGVSFAWEMDLHKDTPVHTYSTDLDAHLIYLEQSLSPLSSPYPALHNLLRFC